MICPVCHAVISQSEARHAGHAQRLSFGRPGVPLRGVPAEVAGICKRRWMPGALSAAPDFSVPNIQTMPRY
jgi:hypothetical protein